MPPHQKALGTQQQPGLGITSAMVLLLYQKWAGVITFGATLTVCNYLLHLVPCQLVLAPTRKQAPWEQRPGLCFAHPYVTRYTWSSDRYIAGSRPMTTRLMDCLAANTKESSARAVPEPTLPCVAQRPPQSSAPAQGSHTFPVVLPLPLRPIPGAPLGPLTQAMTRSLGSCSRGKDNDELSSSYKNAGEKSQPNLQP